MVTKGYSVSLLRFLVFVSILLAPLLLLSSKIEATLTIDKPCYFTKSYAVMNTAAERDHDGNQWRPINSAVDIGLSSDCGGNDTTLAVLDGVVYFNDNIEGFGFYAKLVSDAGYNIFYAHLATNSNTVASGTRVAVGQPIAEIGCTGNCSGEHIHLEVRDSNDDYLSNSTWLFGKVASYYEGAETWTSSAFVGTNGNYFADVTGDGLDDAIVVNSDRIAVRRSDGDKFLSNEYWTTGAFIGTKGNFFADVTGDGKADAIVVNTDRITVRRSNGSSFGSNEYWTSGAFVGTKGNYFADITGDGKADAIVVNTDRIAIRRSNGSTFGSNEFWTSGAFVGTYGNYFSDITGDGKADAIVVNADRIAIRRSSGSAFGSNEFWTSNSYLGTYGNYFADVTGDGKADAMVVNADKVTARYSDGTVFLSNSTLVDGGFAGTYGNYFADVTGDDKLDSISVTSGGVLVVRSV